MGATGGYLQWVVLREKVARAGSWILASTLGFAVAGGALGNFSSAELDYLISLIL